MEKTEATVILRRFFLGCAPVKSDDLQAAIRLAIEALTGTLYVVGDYVHYTQVDGFGHETSGTGEVIEAQHNNLDGREWDTYTLKVDVDGSVAFVTGDEIDGF